jgi:predicted metal-dependent TIM-barrel fold hydrolase
MYIAMSSEVLQQLDLAQRTLRQDLLAEDIRDLLDRNTLVGLLVGRGTLQAHRSASILRRHRVE